MIPARQRNDHERARAVNDPPFRFPWTVLLFLLLSLAAPPAAADWGPLADRLAADGFDREGVSSLFTHPDALFEPDAMAGKLRTLIRSRSAERDAAARPKAYQRDYLKPWAIARAMAYVTENRGLLEEIARRYGVSGEIVVAILQLETRLGANTGTRRVFNRLASMALAGDLDLIRPYLNLGVLTAEDEAYARRRCREKADWAYRELTALLDYSRRNGADPLSIRGSLYGAIGLCQFMPSNIFIYGVDADGDGRIDPFAKPDALHSIANYLHGHGWREGLAREDQHRLIFSYNNSTIYANTVLAVADKLRERRLGRLLPRGAPPAPAVSVLTRTRPLHILNLTKMPAAE